MKLPQSGQRSVQKQRVLPWYAYLSAYANRWRPWSFAIVLSLALWALFGGLVWWLFR